MTAKRFDGKAELVMYGFLLLGDLAWSLKERAVPELAKVQLKEISQDPVLLNFLFGAVPALLSLLVCPLVGAWSDRTRTRYGRRIPFLVALAPLLAASLLALAYSRPIAHRLALWLPGVVASRELIEVACMSLSWAMFELFSVVCNTLFIALIADVVPMAMLGRFFGFFRMLSLTVGVFFFYFIFNNDLPAVLGVVLQCIAVVIFICFLALGLVVREPAYAAAAPGRFRMLRGLHCLAPTGRKFYLLLFGAVGFATICLMPVNINAYNALGQFGVDRNGFGRAVALSYCISIVLAFPLGWLADRLHPLHIGLATLVLYAGSMLCAWFSVAGPASFLFWIVVHGVLTGAYLNGTASLAARLLPREHFSELLSFSAAVSACLAALLSVSMGSLLHWGRQDFRMMFLAASVLAVISVLLWVALQRAHGVLLRQQR